MDLEDKIRLLATENERLIRLKSDLESSLNGANVELSRLNGVLIDRDVIIGGLKKENVGL